MLGGSYAIQLSMNDHNPSSVPRYLVPVLGAGPIEESVFFGIPYYATGNIVVVIISGATWVMLHIFNTKSLDMASLSFSNWLFVMPSFFYSLRTWISGKGWFAILAHSSWNGIFFMLGCANNEYMCSLIPSSGASSPTQIAGIILSIALVTALTYIFYRRRLRIRAESDTRRKSFD
jgi:membrane protease YdiL (CAAX protease family)